MSTKVKAAIRGRHSNGVKLSYEEIAKVNFLVNLISYMLMSIVTIGFILVIGFADALWIPGIVTGIVLATAPFKWFSWLDKIGWNTPAMEAKIRKAKRYTKEMKHHYKDLYKYI